MSDVPQWKMLLDLGTYIGAALIAIIGFFMNRTLTRIERDIDRLDVKLDVTKERHDEKCDELREDINSLGNSLRQEIGRKNG